MIERLTVMKSLPATVAASLFAAFDWWRAELLAMMPAALRLRLGLTRPVLQAWLNGDNLVLVTDQRGRSEQIYSGQADEGAVAKVLAIWRQRLDAGDMDVEIMLDPGDVLVRRIELPLAVQYRLTDALDFELGRHTPFSPGDVYMSWLAGEPQNDRLPVTLAVVARDHIGDLARRLRLFGLDPAFARSGDDFRFRIVGRSGLRRRALVTIALAGAIAVLALLLVNIELGRQEERLSRINTEVRRERSNAVEVERWKGELAQSDRRQRFFGEKIADKRVSVALNRLSRDLPDDVWLQQMTMQNGEIRLYGYAPEPATVINVLEANGYFENARFRSPSTRRSGTAVDRFDISAQIRKGSGS
jgi:general secretion pathway protein L